MDKSTISIPIVLDYRIEMPKITQTLILTRKFYINRLKKY
jgi:hypothetical protein